MRINPDGSVPQDNPFVGKSGARPEIWSYGHRNPQGAAIHPVTGKLWESEFGPKGGDEINIPEAGKDYGWPVVSWGSNYDDTPIPAAALTSRIRRRDRALEPGDLTVGNRLLHRGRDTRLEGTISCCRGFRPRRSSASLSRTRPSPAEERIPMGTRIRDVVQGPDGAVYALTDEADGKILRLSATSTN